MVRVVLLGGEHTWRLVASAASVSSSARLEEANDLIYIRAAWAHFLMPFTCEKLRRTSPTETLGESVFAVQHNPCGTNLSAYKF